MKKVLSVTVSVLFACVLSCPLLFVEDAAAADTNTDTTDTNPDTTDPLAPALTSCSILDDPVIPWSDFGYPWANEVFPQEDPNPSYAECLRECGHDGSGDVLDLACQNICQDLYPVSLSDSLCDSEVPPAINLSQFCSDTTPTLEPIKPVLTTPLPDVEELCSYIECAKLEAKKARFFKALPGSPNGFAGRLSCNGDGMGGPVWEDQHGNSFSVEFGCDGEGNPIVYFEVTLKDLEQIFCSR